LTIIANKIVLLNNGVQQKELKNNERVQVKMSGDPVVRITTSVAVVRHSEFVEKSSD